MIAIATVLGGIGLACMLYKRTLLGVLIGAQILAIGAAMAFLVAGSVSAANAPTGHVLALLATLGGVAFTVAGYAISMRLFYLRRRTGMDETRSLKH
jgi:NADH:ubiquinone oxidoreductase subunit K